MLARKSTLIVLNAFVGAVLGFVALKVVALYMGADIYGQLAYATSLVGTLTFLGNLGFTKAHTKRVSEGRDLEDCISTFAAWNAGVAAIYILIVLGGLIVNELFFDKTFVSTTVGTLLLVTLAEATFYIRRVARGTFQARVEAARAEISIFTEHAVRTPVMMLAALFYASAKGRKGPIFDFLRDTAPGVADVVGDYAPEALAFAVFASGLLSMGVGLFLLLRNFKPGKVRFDLLKSYAEFGIPVLGASSMNSLQSHADNAMLGFFWSDRATGQYHGMQRVLSFFHVVYSAVGQMFFPLVSEYHAEGDYEAMRSVLNKALRYLSMVTVPVAFGATALAEPVIRVLLSDDFVAAAPILIIMAFQIPLKGVNTTLTHLQYGTDEPKIAAGLSILNSVANIGFGLLLVPASLFGIKLGGFAGVGAAVGTLSAYVIDVVLRSWWSRDYLDPGVLGHMVRHWLAGGVMAFAVWAVQDAFLPAVRWFHLPLLVAGGGLFYVACLWLFREFKEEQFRFFWEAIHPGDMTRYVRDELETEEDRDEE